jgi:hypothetical protein
MVEPHDAGCAKGIMRQVLELGIVNGFDFVWAVEVMNLGRRVDQSEAVAMRRNSPRQGGSQPAVGLAVAGKARCSVLWVRIGRDDATQLSSTIRGNPTRVPGSVRVLMA